jgi:hypothetical protein
MVDLAGKRLKRFTVHGSNQMSEIRDQRSGRGRELREFTVHS